MKKAEVYPIIQRSLIRRLRLYSRQIERINNDLADLCLRADALASDIGDDLLFVEHEVEQYLKTKEGKLFLKSKIPASKVRKRG